MKATDAFPSKYIKAEDLQGNDVVVKITHAVVEKLNGEDKVIVYFAGKTKGLVCNKTNFKQIVKITGQDDTDDWTGASVCLYETMVDFQGDSVPAVRVKSPPKKNGTQQTARPSSADQGRDDFPGDRPTRKPASEELNDEIGF